jgi:hypothetical protein
MSIYFHFVLCFDGIYIGNNTCFYGVCYFCGPNQPVCAQKDVMEGALILWLPLEYKLKKHRSPWQRTYKPQTVAR